MVSFLLSRWAMSCEQIVQWVIGLPNCLVAYCSSVIGTVRPIDCFVPIVHLSADGTLTRCFALSLGLDTSFS